MPVIRHKTNRAQTRGGLLTPSQSFTSAGDAPEERSLEGQERSAGSEPVPESSERVATERISAARPVIGSSTPLLTRQSLVVPSNPNDHLIWLDLETTGLELEDYILEIALFVTDKRLRELDKGVSYLIHHNGKNVWEKAPQIVKNMHVESGLRTEYDSTPQSRQLTLQEVDELVACYIQKHRISRGVLAGGGIQFDRNMIKQWMPKTNALLAYQTMDVTAHWHPISRVYNRTQRSKGKVAHRAMADARGAHAEMKEYLALYKPLSEVEPRS